MENTQKRNSNFELLRIVAIFLIILFHIQIHGPQPVLETDNLHFAKPQFYYRLLVFEIGSPLGMVSNHLFILISGYFLIQKSNIDAYKVSKKLLLQIGYATAFLAIVSVIYFKFFWRGYPTLKLLTLSSFNNDWWFIGYYLLIVIMAKMFVNNFLQKLNQSEYLSFIIVLFAITQFQWTGNILDNLANGLRATVVGIFLYALGGYIYIYNPFKKIKIYAIIFMIVATYIMRFVANYNFTQNNISIFISKNSTGNFIQRVQSSSRYEITAIILAICIFEIFRRITLPNIKIINYLGQSSLIVYLVHENQLFISLYSYRDWMPVLENSLVLYLVKWFSWATIAFLFGVISYTIYYFIMRITPKCKKLIIKDTIE